MYNYDENNSKLSLYSREEAFKFKIELDEEFEEKYNEIRLTRFHQQDVTKEIKSFENDFTINLENVITKDIEFGDESVKLYSNNSKLKGYIYDLSPNKEYTFYAYAKSVKDKVWYKIGHDTEIPDPIERGNIEITEIEGIQGDVRKKLTNTSNFKINSELTLWVSVKNSGKKDFPEYYMHIFKDRISKRNRLDYDHEDGIGARDDQSVVLEIESTRLGVQKYIICVTKEKNDFKNIILKKEIEIKWESENNLANALSDMPLAKLYGFELPASFNDYGSISKEIMDEPFNIVFKAGLNSDHSSDVFGLGSINFDNGVLDGISIGGKSVTIPYGNALKGLPEFGDKLRKYLKDMDFDTTTFTAGRIDISNKDLNLVALEIQDSKRMVPYKQKLFNRLTISKKASWDEILAALEAAADALIITFALIIIALIAINGEVIIGLGYAAISMINTMIKIISERLDALI